MTGTGKKADPYRFDDDVPGNEHEQAVLGFTLCRDLDRPIVVQTGNTIERFFPSGRAEFLGFYPSKTQEVS